jgi:glycosyltransferase involved in cell wall biosynthesis
MELVTSYASTSRNGAGTSSVDPMRARRRAVDQTDATTPARSPFSDHAVSVVIPAMNEAENLSFVLPRIPEWVSEVVIVDGNSIDGTPDVVIDFWRTMRRRNDDPALKVVTQLGRGKGLALRTGFSAASGDIIVMLDADGSTDPGEIPRFVGMLVGGMDFAKGSRFLPGGGTADMPLYRKLGNWSFVALVRMLFGGTYTDLCYGYNAFWRRVLDDLDLDGDGFEIETIMNVRALRAGLKLAEVPSYEAERIYGTSNLRTIPDGWRVLNAIKREWGRELKRRTGVSRSSAPLVLRAEDRADLPAEHRPTSKPVSF